MSVYEVTTEDGSVYEVTTEDSPQVQPKAEPYKLQSAGEVVAGGLTNLLQGLTFGAGDEILGAGGAVIDAARGKGWTYGDRLEQARTLSEAYARENPVSGTLNSLTGLFAPGPAILSKAKGLKGAAATIGKGAGVGAAYGASSGFLSGEGSAAERLAAAEDAATTGAIIGGGLGAAASTARGVGRKLAEQVPQLERKSVGARQSDYAKTAKDIGILDVDGELQTTTKAALDDLLANNKLGASRDPQALLSAANKNEKALSGEIGKEISQADKALGKPVMPLWNKALEMLESGQVPGEKIDAYTRRLKQINEAIQQQGRGKLSFIQQQKVALGKSWDPNDGVLNEFNRALYTDLQRTIEVYAPRVSELNRELSKYKVVKPILQRGLAATENADSMNSVIGAIRTSGGWGVPILSGAYAGGLPGAAAGAAVAYGLKQFGTPAGRKLTADALKVLAPKVSQTGSALGSGAAVRAFTPTEQNSDRKTRSQTGTTTRGKQDQSIPSFNSGPFSALSQRGVLPRRADAKASVFATDSAAKKNGSEPVKYEEKVNRVLPALIKAESAGNAKAKSPKGAMGLMQIMPATFKEWSAKLGIKNPDPYNKEHNIQVGTAYLDWLLDEFNGDLPLSLAAYNYGIGNVKKKMKARGNTLADIYPALPEETQKYVLKIITNMANA